jgi:hypothetical protein
LCQYAAGHRNGGRRDEVEVFRVRRGAAGPVHGARQRDRAINYHRLGRERARSYNVVRSIISRLPTRDTRPRVVMAINKPFRRNARPFINGTYNTGAASVAYVMHPKFANDAEQYVRAFLILQKDIQELFEYIEPSDNNLPCHSYRGHALLMRLCIEVEANFKAILIENSYGKRGNLNIGDYLKIDSSHRLSSYEIKMPVWHGTANIRKPFLPWQTTNPLPWYQAYNRAKHDRHTHFEDAKFEHVVDAMCGLVAVIASQFIQEDFSPLIRMVRSDAPGAGFQLAIGNYFLVRFPDDWPDSEKYEFDWYTNLQNDLDPFENIQF